MKKPYTLIHALSALLIVFCIISLSAPADFGSNYITQRFFTASAGAPIRASENQQHHTQDDLIIAFARSKERLAFAGSDLIRLNYTSLCIAGLFQCKP